MDGQQFTRTVPSVEVKDLLEADGAIFEAPVSSALLTVAQVVQDSWRSKNIQYYYNQQLIGCNIPNGC